VTNGKRRRLAILMAIGFAVILIAITIGNALSSISDFAADGVPVPARHVWIWETTSIAAWVSTMPAIWWAVARVRPPRLSWPAVAAIALAGLPVASGWHIGAMIALRHPAYAAFGETYRFEGALAQPYLYEFRKDIGTYLQFVGIFALAQWLLARIATPDEAVRPPAAEAPARLLEISDGATRHQIPVDRIEHVAAAGNYVEINLADRTLLHRATLAAVEQELGARFVRIHRSRLINREAVRRIETERSGDFSVALESGALVRGSRRYRQAL
jgi:hypothetical protein